MRRLLTAMILPLTLLAGADASAQQQTPEGFAIDRLEPSERGGEWFALDALDIRGGLRPALGVVASHQYRPLVFYRANDEIDSSIVRNQLVLHAGGAVVLADRFRIAANMPLALHLDGHGSALGGQRYPAPPREQALGDLRLGLVARLLGEARGPLTIAGGVQGWIPTGSKEAYTGDGEPRVAPQLLAAGEVGWIAYAAKVGWQYRARTGTFAGVELGSEVVFGLAVGARFARGAILVGPELFGSTSTSGDQLGKPRATPMEALLGAHVKLGDLRIGGGAGAGLSRGLGAPEARALLSLEWVPAAVADPDLDGILGSDDACPDAKGVHTDDTTTNGCPPSSLPPPPDRDGDAVLDRDDACPDTPGDPAWDGCPADRDRDGVLDKDDACPADPGMRTDDPATSGCPDRDGDGVLDKDDACRDVPGLKTRDPATHGCPRYDRDKDGIFDDEDACPDTAGEPSTDWQRHGCPRAELRNDEIRIQEAIMFRTDSDVIEGSEPILEAVVAILRAHPEIKRLRVEGHTDSFGVAKRNKDLSARRAAAVAKWLVGKGIDRARLTSVGLGQERPLFDNTTDDGRRQNRRVEFHVEKTP